MTIPAVILRSDAPPAYRLIGGLPLVTRHIKELSKLGVREFYLCGVVQVPLAIQSDCLPVDARLYAVPCTQDEIPRRRRTGLDGGTQDLLTLQKSGYL